MNTSLMVRLKSMGVVLPRLSPPGGKYAPIIRHGSLVFVSGQTSITPDESYVGKVGKDLSIEQAQQAALLAARKMIAVLCGELGGLEKIHSLIRLTGFVNATPEFVDQTQVVDSASEFFEKLFLQKHARLAIGVGSLPKNSAVELEAIFSFYP